MLDHTLTPEEKAAAIAAGDAALRRLFELFRDQPGRPYRAFTRYHLIIEHGEVRLVPDEIDRMVEEALGESFGDPDPDQAAT